MELCPRSTETAETGVKERPILMSAPMVRATLREVDPKGQTRRIVKGTAFEWLNDVGFTQEFVALPESGLCPYGLPGDRLWVRETHFINDLRGAKVPADERAGCEILYRATDEQWVMNMEDTEGLRWAPSIHMPRWASRITLEITGVRVERLQDISEADAIAEGVAVNNEPFRFYSSGLPNDIARPNAISAYCDLWEGINGAGSWEANPWIWVIEFRRLS